MKVTFLGTGTSTGVPAIGCDCEICRSTDPRDKRLRVSLLIEHEGRNILIDTSADFRQQALRVGLKELHAVLITHCHADHVFGIDDVRPINQKVGPIPFFANEIAWIGMREMFSYIFRPRGASSQPEIVPHTIYGPFSLFGLEIQPLEVIHGNLPVLAFRIGRMAYVTDCNLIPEAACEGLRDLDVLILDCLHYNPHPTHLNLEESLRYVAKLTPRHTYFTHMSHRVSHAGLSAELPSGVELAYDGLTFEI
ncbi:MAG: MBL fold metallo-hydrolase [Blastocatellia bacterium]|nr:MBL fold metallo-hydrolase [Blastocatellia bacterium]